MRTQTYGINSFGYQDANIKVWNALDQKLKNAMTTDDFKKCILQWKGFICNFSGSYCNMCFKDIIGDHIIMYITSMNIVIVSISHPISCSPLMSFMSVNSTLVLVFYCSKCIYRL